MNMETRLFQGPHSLRHAALGTSGATSAEVPRHVETYGFTDVAADEKHFEVTIIEF